MQSESQYEQLIMQYQQLRNGAEDIARMIEREDYDNAITMLKLREQTFLNCKCIRRYLELTPVQQAELDALLDDIRSLELKNMKSLEKGMNEIQRELKKTQQSQKFQQAYQGNADTAGSIANFEE